MLGHFQKLGVTPEEVFALLEVLGPDDVTLHQLAKLKGLATAFKEGDAHPDETFAEVRAASGARRR